MNSRNRRLAAVLTAAVFSAAPALTAGAAYASPGSPSVEFTGGSVLNTLVCRSEPSTARLVVPAEGRVMFVNRLGQSAALRIDGRTVTSVGVNQAVPVVFRYGPANVSMAIPCNVGVVEEFRSVTVSVAAKAASPAFNAAGGVGAAAPTSRTSAGPTATMRPGGRVNGGTPPAGRGDENSSEEPNPWAMETGSSASNDQGGSGSETNQSPAGDQVPGAGLPVAASGTPVRGPSGLLAMVATVLTIGVGVAAVRAILARRTSRAAFA